MTVQHASPYQLEALRVATLDRDEELRVRTHLASCLPCRRLASEIDEAHLYFTQDVAPRTSFAVERRLSRWRRPLRGAIAGSLLSLVALFVVILRPHRDASAPIEPVFIAKGGAVMSVIAKRGTNQFEVHDGDALAGGDEIRFRLAGVTGRYAIVISVDGNGTTTVYWPFAGTHSAPIGAGSGVALGGSVVLDGSPGPERIFGLVSDAPIDAQPVVGALQRLHAAGPSAVRATTHLDGVPAAAQSTILVEKKTMK